MADKQKVEYELTLKDLLKEKLEADERAATKLEGTLLRMGGVVGGALAVGGLIAFGRELTDTLSNFESFQASVRTMLKGNEEATQTLLGDLRETAKTTPFQLTELQDATKSMLAFGSTATGVIGELRMLGDISSGIGAPVKEIAELYGKARVQGRLFGEDVNQLTGRGIPVIQEFAKQFGVSQDKVKKLVEEGKIGFPELEKAFQNMTGTGGQFNNMMDAQSKTIGGMVSNVEDNWNDFKLMLATELRPVIVGITELLNSMIENAKGAIAWMKEHKDLLQAMGVGILAAAAAWGIYVAVTNAAAIGTAIMTAAQWALNAALTANPLGIIIVAIGAFVAAIVYAYKKSAEFRAFLWAFWAVIKEIGAIIKDYFMGLYNVMMGVFTLDLDQIKKGWGQLESATFDSAKRIGKAAEDGYKEGIADFQKQQAEEAADAAKKKGAPTTVKGVVKSTNVAVTKKEGSSVTGNKSTTINIKIDNLIKEFTVKTSKLDEAMPKIKEMVAQVLISAVNDSQIVAGS